MKPFGVATKRDEQRLNDTLDVYIDALQKVRHKQAIISLQAWEIADLKAEIDELKAELEDYAYRIESLER